MSQISLWQLTLEPSSHSLDPDRIATNLFTLSVQIFTELASNGGQYFDDLALEKLIYQKDRYRVWGANLDARDGGLDGIVVDAELLRKALLPLLCRMAKALVDLACRTNLRVALADVFQQINELESYVHSLLNEADSDHGLSQSDDVLPAITVDDFSSSGSEASSQEEVSEIQEALEDLEFRNDLLYKLAPALYDSAEMAMPIPDSSKSDDARNYQMLQTRAWPYITSVLEAYPSIDQSLARRLGEANEFRYIRLQKHREMASIRENTSETESPIEEDPSMSQPVTTIDEAPIGAAPSQTTAQSTYMSSIFDAPHTSTKAKTHVLPKVAPSVTTFTAWEALQRKFDEHRSNEEIFHPDHFKPKKQIHISDETEYYIKRWIQRSTPSALCILTKFEKEKLHVSAIIHEVYYSARCKGYEVIEFLTLNRYDRTATTLQAGLDFVYCFIFQLLKNKSKDQLKQYDLNKLDIEDATVFSNVKFESAINILKQVLQTQQNDKNSKPIILIVDEFWQICTRTTLNNTREQWKMLLALLGCGKESAELLHVTPNFRILFRVNGWFNDFTDLGFSGEMCAPSTKYNLVTLRNTLHHLF